MENNQKIYKFEINLEDNPFKLNVPINFNAHKVGFENGIPYMYGLGKDATGTEEHIYMLCQTDEIIPVNKNKMLLPIDIVKFGNVGAVLHLIRIFDLEDITKNMQENLTKLMKGTEDV